MINSEVEPADQELIHLIAERQDQQAFARLFERHKRRGYRLALYITHDAEAAEEALQEAMITIWRSAKAYNGSGKVEAWMMRIISHAALQQIRKSKQKRTHAMVDDDPPCEAPSPQARLADTEMVLLLRKALVALSAPDRQLIALRFAAGMTQPEISDALRIPQQTVSYRIESIVKRLRAVLPNSEFIAVPALSEILREAVFSGNAVPKGEFAEIIKSISNPRKTVRRRSFRPSRNFATGKLAIAATLVAVTGVTTVLFLKPNPVPATATESRPQTAPTPVVAQPKFSYRWSFENGLPPDLTMKGFGGWDKDRKALAAKNVNSIIFPFQLPSKPVKITCELIWEGKEDFACAANAIEPTPLQNGDFKLSPVKQIWNSHSVSTILLSSTQPIPSGDSTATFERKTFVAYLWENHVVEFYGNFTARVVDLADPLAGKKLWLKFNNTSVLSIKAEAIDEIPMECRDPGKLTAGLTPSRPTQ